MLLTLFVAVCVWGALVHAYAVGWRDARELSQRDPWLPPEQITGPACFYGAMIVFAVAVSWASC